MDLASVLAKLSAVKQAELDLQYSKLALYQNVVDILVTDPHNSTPAFKRDPRYHVCQGRPLVFRRDQTVEIRQCNNLCALTDMAQAKIRDVGDVMAEVANRVSFLRQDIATSGSASWVPLEDPPYARLSTRGKKILEACKAIKEKNAAVLERKRRRLDPTQSAASAPGHDSDLESCISEE